jgi:uncharacterized membrane protein YjdF
MNLNTFKQYQLYGITRPKKERSLNVNVTMLILIYLGIALVGSRVPFLRVYFALCNTLVQEVVHAFSSLLLKGELFSKIKLHKDGTGETVNQIHAPFKKVLIAYAGYTGTSLAAIGLFYLVSRDNFDLIVYMFIGLIGLSLLLWIRNLYGFIWALSFGLLVALPIYFGNELVIMHVSIMLASVIFTQSIFQAYQLFRQSFMRRKNPHRTAALAQTALIPAVIWGVVLLGQSLYAGYFIFKNFLS